MSDIANKFNELPPETQEFLSDLRVEDIATLKDGLRLVIAIRTVGTFMKWVIVGILGMVLDIVAFGKAVIEIFTWFRN